MAVRILLFVFCCALLAKDSAPTMATRRVVNAQEFSTMRAKAMSTMPKKKKQRRPSTREGKSHWGVPKARAKK